MHKSTYKRHPKYVENRFDRNENNCELLWLIMNIHFDSLTNSTFLFYFYDGMNLSSSFDLKPIVIIIYTVELLQKIPLFIGIYKLKRHILIHFHVRLVLAWIEPKWRNNVLCLTISRNQPKLQFCNENMQWSNVTQKQEELYVITLIIN